MAGTIVLDAITDGTGNTVSGSTVVNGSVKAWVRFTVSGTTPTIVSSFNISSVTYTATGQFSFTFTTALANANYTAVGNSGINTALSSFVNSMCFGSNVVGSYYTVPTTSGFTMSYVNTAQAFDNPKYVCLLVC